MSKGNERMLPTVKEVEETFGERIEFMGLFLAGDERGINLNLLCIFSFNKYSAKVL